MNLTYKSAGVDLDLYEQAMERIPAFAKRTHTPRVMPLAGGFAGLFQLNGDGNKYNDPVLVSGTDGVGTKIKIAQMTGQFNTIGIDLVAMCVNDCLCLGAEPLFFLDYLAMAKDDPDLIASLVEGVSEGCVQAGAALIGGETAIMPDLYQPGDFDLAGFCVGVAEKDQLLDGSRIQPGDQLIGVPSSGLHSNGFSLVRKIVFEHAGLSVDTHLDDFGCNVGELLLTPTKIYAKTVQSVLDSNRESITGIAHITGGGLSENVSRILPDGCQLAIDDTAIETPAVFTWLQELGNVADDEMQRVFNMGTGLVFVVQSTQVDAVLTAIQTVEPEAAIIGDVR